MIYSLKGVVTAIEAGLVVVECMGVGYACRTTMTSLSGLKEGAETLLYTQLNVREDAVELFGFATKAELNCFKQLTSISGVGPKAALSVLSSFTPESFALTIMSGDYKSLTKTPGIGAKTAQRIVLELKDKIEKQSTFTSAEFKNATSVTVESGSYNEAISALTVLGFSPAQASKGLEGEDTALTTSELVKIALKKLSKR